MDPNPHPEPPQQQPAPAARSRSARFWGGAALVLLGVVALAAWAARLCQPCAGEHALAQGAVVRIKCAAPAPADLVQGRFLVVRPEQQTVEVPKDGVLGQDSPAYAILSTGADGLATVTRLTLEEPASGDYLVVKAGVGFLSATQHVVFFDWPFERFDIGTKLAPESRDFLAEILRPDPGLIAEVRVCQGRAVLAGVSVGGRPLHEVLQERLTRQ